MKPGLSRMALIFSGVGARRDSSSCLPIRYSTSAPSSVAAVPALLTPEGQTMYGTKAFEWLKQYEADVELESFYGNGSLAFSEVGGMGYATYDEGFGDFEAPK